MPTKLHVGKVRVDIKKIALLGEECNTGAGYPGRMGTSLQVFRLEGVRDNGWLEYCEKQVY